ncbi:MAG TPA: GntR family transcriptional regulator [Solirubrobacteraceae bacterium]|nr:GntR family transcriptional regulator [Solirubrobacteraceae bacterium]
MPAAPRAPLVSEQVFGDLLESLLAGRYAPGERLPTQRALAADLGVTMSTLREALKRLEQMGLIESRQGDGMRVRDWRAHGGLDVVAHLLFRAGGVDGRVLADVLEARSLMLAELAALAAERRDDGAAARLAALAGEFAAAPDAAAAQRIDFAFVTELATAAQNLVFVLVLNSIRALYFAHADELPVAARPAELAPLYARAAAAVAAGDGSGARAAMTELAARQRERVQSAIEGRA